MDVHSSPDAPQEALVIQEFTIKPSQSIKIDLGTFRQKHRPEFTLHVHDPARLESPGAMVYSDITLPKANGTYRLVRTVQSYSQTTHVVTISFASAADERLQVG
jgi:hypothetical protein